MVDLMLHLAFAVGFFQSLRWAQVAGAKVLAAATVNYVVAAIGAALWFWFQGHFWADVTGPTRILSAAAGILFAVHLLVLLPSYRLAGVGITIAVTTSAAVVPVLIAWWFWGDAMNVYRWIAVGLLPVALTLMRPDRGGQPHLGLKAEIFLALSFLCASAIFTIHRAIQETGDHQARGYHMILFAFAALTALVAVAAKRMPIRRIELKIGIPMGLANVINVFFLLRALPALGASVFFPISSSGSIALNVIVARWLWNERMAKRQALGLLLTIVVVVLVRWG